MKKLKIMLLSLALFAVVGVALAFKAKFNRAYCTAPTFIIAGEQNICLTTCPDITLSTTDFGTELVCTTFPQQGQCVDDHNRPLTCNTTTLLTKDN